MLISKFIGCDINRQIDTIEKDYKIVLPVVYKQFLKKYNGGYTPLTKFRIGKISSDVRGFYGLGSVPLSLDKLKLIDWTEKRMVLIACDSFGNNLTMGVHKDNYGKIFFCNHEEDGSSTLIAENLKGFIDACKSDRIREASRKSIQEREMALIEQGREANITENLRKMWQAEIDKYKDIIQEEVILT